MVGKRMKNEDRIGFELLTVIFGGEWSPEIIRKANAFIIIPDFPRSTTFGEVLAICRKNGYTGGCVTVIAENPLSGAVYRYDGAGDWWKVGTTIGYEC